MEHINLSKLERMAPLHLRTDYAMLFRFRGWIHLASFSYANFYEDFFNISNDLDNTVEADYMDIFNLRWNI